MYLFLKPLGFVVAVLTVWFFFVCEVDDRWRRLNGLPVRE